MECKQNHADRRRRRDDETDPPDPGFDPHTRGPGGERYPGLVLSALVALIGLGTVGSAVLSQPGEAAAAAIVLLGGIVTIAGAYNTLRRAIEIRPSIAADVATVACGLCLVLTALTVDRTAPVFWSGLAGGALVAALAGYDGYRTRENRSIARDARTRG